MKILGACMVFFAAAGLGMYQAGRIRKGYEELADDARYAPSTGALYKQRLVSLNRIRLSQYCRRRILNVQR